MTEDRKTKKNKPPKSQKKVNKNNFIKNPEKGGTPPKLNKLKAVPHEKFNHPNPLNQKRTKRTE